MTTSILQLLRNSELCANKKEAVAKISAKLKTLPVGAPAIASYTDGDAKSILFGIAYDATNYQIFEGAKVDGGGNLELPEEVKTKLDAIQAELNKTQTGAGLGDGGAYIPETGSNYIDEATSLKDADKKLDAAIKAVEENATKVKAGNGINVQETGHTATVSVKVNELDKVLTVDGNGILTNINLTWDKQQGLKLIGKNSEPIATIPATDFIKDGMLENVELVALSGGTETNPEDLEDGTYLKFTFNTDGGAKVLYVNVTSLIDIYTAGNGITVSGNNQISAKVKEGDAFLQVTSDGIRTKENITIDCGEY